MTTNEDAGSDPDERTLVGRRSYIKAAASAVTLGAAGAGSAAAAGEDYDVIEVPAGRTHTITLGSGDTLENTLIDISARNAKFQISARGSGWEVRNLGIRGNWDETQKAEPFIVSGDGVIDNYYFADGATGNTYPNGPTGIYVANAHSGTIRINNVNIQDMPDNAIYGSSPGDLPSHPSGGGGGGDVIITNSYAADCVASSFRVGTDGSRVENCVSVGSDCGFWAFYNSPKVVDCDFSDSNLGDIRVGDGHWQANARPRLENVRYETDVIHSGSVVGSSAGSPQRTSPEEVEGVPLSAEEAASGGGSGGVSPSPPSNGDEPDEDGEDDEELEGHLLAFVTKPEARNAEYEFTAEGAVELAEADYESPSGRSIGANGNDSVEESDGTARVSGLTGGGYGDAYRVAGPVTSIDIDQPDVMWVELDGEKMSVEEVIEATSGDDSDEDDENDENEASDHLLAFVTDADARYAEYEFTAEGAVELADADYESPSGRSIGGNGNDAIEESDGKYRVSGLTGGGYGDAFRVSGPVTSIDIDQPDVMWVELDGEEMSVEEVIEATSGDDDEDDSGNEDDDASDGPSNALVIDATETGASAEYRFEVSGSVEKATHRDATIDDGDSVDGTAVKGSVDSAKDAYWFSGDITDFWLNGDALVDVEYNAR
ncbi:right-handed parallel beta-helix repeat-containing protein [Halopiger aswanensis]|uniref:Uncharacterized protein n=1 Tax=Halopiger aswanensis TaxID=148449 RepID=A0A3R7HK14_9EURY|nr:right-handed parallel beta-helix repeat-containing protein [Halopiger aswanensis]RKD97402.1 hypothetical protein ATJ93_0388 [Halopiger aswanensis]